MRKLVKSPRILLVGCPIDFARQVCFCFLKKVFKINYIVFTKHNKVQSLDTLLQQEKKHLQLIVDKIIALEVCFFFLYLKNNF